MAHFAQIRVSLTNFKGAPGVMTFATPIVGDTALVGNLRTALHTFLNGNIGLSGVVQYSIPSEGYMINEATGDVDGTWTEPGGDLTGGGGGSGAYMGPAGAVVTWTTGTVRGNRLMRGRTFLVPAASSIADSDGSISPTILTGIQSRASALAASGFLAVYGRPTPVAPGLIAPVTGSRVPDMLAVLRSRRT